MTFTSISSLQGHTVAIQSSLVQKLLQKPSAKKLEKYLEKMVGESVPAFETPLCYEEFLTLLKVCRPNFANRDLYAKALRLFRVSLGLPEKIFNGDVTLVGKAGKSCTLAKEILELNFEYFKALLQPAFSEGSLNTINCFLPSGQPLSEETLECFKSYVYQKKIKASTIGLLDELLAWANFMDDPTFKEDVSLSLLDYLASKEHVDDFDARYVEGHGREFTMSYLSKRGITLSDSTKISLSEFCHLAQEKTSSALEFVFQFIDTIIIDDQNPDLLELIPKKFRRSIKFFETSNLLSIENIAKLGALFPNAEFSTLFLEHTLKKFPPDNKNPFSTLLAAQLAHRKNDLNNAKELYEAVLILEPKNACARGRLGNVYRQQGRSSEAEEHLKKAIELDPKSALALSWLGEVYRLQVKLLEAEELFKKAIELHPKSAFARGRLGDVYRLQGKFLEAEEHFKKAIELLPKDAFLLSRLGDAYICQGKLLEAEEHFKKAIELLPKDEFLLSRLGDVYRQQGKLLEAEEHFKKAIELDPKNAFAQGRLGDVYRLQSKLLEAEEHLKKAIELHPKDAFAQGRLGDVYRQQGKLLEAEEHFKKAIELDPKDTFARSRLGDVYRQQDKLLEAEEHFKKAIELSPKDAFLLSRLGHVYRQQGKLLEAEEYFKKAIELAPKDAFAQGRLGDVYRQQGKLLEAEEHLKKAIELHPKDAFAQGSLGDVYRQQGKLLEAEEHLKKAIELDPKDTFARSRLGDVYRQQGKLPGVEEQFIKAIKLDSKDQGQEKEASHSVPKDDDSMDVVYQSGAKRKIDSILETKELAVVTKKARLEDKK